MASSRFTSSYEVWWDIDFALILLNLRFSYKVATPVLRRKKNAVVSLLEGYAVDPAHTEKGY